MFPFPRPARAPAGFSQAVADSLLHLAACGRAAATLDSYGRALRSLGAALHGRELASRTDGDVDRAMLVLEKGEGRERAQTTLDWLRTTCRSFFRWAPEGGRLPRNPAAALRRARAVSRPTAPIRPDETERLLDAIRRSRDPRARRAEALVAVLSFTGLRRGETLALRAEDYDSKARTLTVRRGKAGPGRTVPVSRRLAEALGRTVAPAPGPPAAPLFPGGKPSRPLSARRLDGRFGL